jgi:hypothetical protein
MPGWLAETMIKAERCQGNTLSSEPSTTGAA